jgi:hypothetical protein
MIFALLSSLLAQDDNQLRVSIAATAVLRANHSLLAARYPPFATCAKDVAPTVVTATAIHKARKNGGNALSNQFATSRKFGPSLRLRLGAGIRGAACDSRFLALTSPFGISTVGHRDIRLVNGQNNAISAADLRSLVRGLRGACVTSSIWRNRRGKRRNRG